MPNSFRVKVAAGKIPLKKALDVSEFTNDSWAIGYQISSQKTRLIVSPHDKLGKVLPVFSSKAKAIDFIGAASLDSRE